MHVQRSAGVNVADYRWDHHVGYLIEQGYRWDENRGWHHDDRVRDSSWHIRDGRCYRWDDEGRGWKSDRSPDLIRTWAGSNGPVSAEYDWHPLAKLWQDPVAGDRWAEEYDAAAFAKDLTDNHQIPAQLAEQTAGRVDETMRDSILKLYRSALTVGAEWEPDLANLAGPSLVFWGALDPVCSIEFGEKMAASVRATRFLRLDSSHWTPIQKPAEVATALEEHWSSSLG
ncbi:alpha/beta hydrolase [Streptomyces sp. NPDC007883]|uniref:alpha/beta fold hydrolase n=1 Tax=Streptomyces sp. NPDC007883 TaxID=3155116 RepID=UPI0033FBC126